MQRGYVLVALFAIALFAIACAGDPVGDPCTPEHVPPGGFDSSETYVESSSSECVTRVCLVRGLSGDPRAECMRLESGAECATERDVAASVYCSCRCDPAGSIQGCACPDGYRCEDTGRLGSYCVRD